MQRQRATMAYNARNVVSILFPTIAVTAETPAERASDPEAERLIGKEETKKYSLLPPILYPPTSNNSNSLLFRNPALLQVRNMLTNSSFLKINCHPLARTVPFVWPVFNRSRKPCFQARRPFDCQKVASDKSNTWVYCTYRNFGEFISPSCAVTS